MAERKKYFWIHISLVNEGHSGEQTNKRGKLVFVIF